MARKSTQPRTKDTCVVCGEKIRVMAFIGTGICSNRCKKEAGK